MHTLLSEAREGWATRLWEAWEPPEPQGEEPSGQTSELFAPRGPGELAEHYDLTISHPAVEQAPFAVFDRWLARAAAARGLSCALIHDGVVQEVVQRLSCGEMTIGFHLDCFSYWRVADASYARLAWAVQDSGGRPINSPARARVFTDKAAVHAELQRRGLGVPATVVLRPWVGDRDLTAAERSRLRLDEVGARVFIKPANGFGDRGVVRVERTDPHSLAAALTAARDQDRADSFLIQREVPCPRLEGEDGVERPAHWRILSCLGELFPFWWQSEVAQQWSSYRRLTAAEIRRHQLQPVLDFVVALGQLTGLDWFATEVCLSDGPERSRFMVPASPPGAAGKGLATARPVLAIDYVNNPCDVDVQSRWPSPPPERLVRHLAERFAEAAWEQRRLMAPRRRYSA
jgi:hypothetical protein